MRISKYKIVSIILFLIYIGLFIGFVSMALEDSAKSTDTSSVVAEVVVEVVEAVTPSDYVVNEEKVHLFTRKLIGHFGYNMVMGAILMLAIYFLFKKDKEEDFKIKYLFNFAIISFITSIVIAVLSELLQLIPSGRSCSFTDMAIDYGGAVLGIIVSLVILLIIWKVKNNKKIDKEL